MMMLMLLLPSLPSLAEKQRNVASDGYNVRFYLECRNLSDSCCSKVNDQIQKILIGPPPN